MNKSLIAQHAKELIDILFIPLSILTGYLLKHQDLITWKEKLAYVVFAGAAAWFCPDVLTEFFPDISKNAYSFISFLAAAFIGLLMFNLWKIFADGSLLRRAIVQAIKHFFGGES